MCFSLIKIMTLAAKLDTILPVGVMCNLYSSVLRENKCGRTLNETVMTLVVKLSHCNASVSISVSTDW